MHRVEEEQPAIGESLEATRDTRTEAEKRFEKVQEERERARIEKAAKMTYRDQVEVSCSRISPSALDERVDCYVVRVRLDPKQTKRTVCYFIVHRDLTRSLRQSLNISTFRRSPIQSRVAAGSLWQQDILFSYPPSFWF
mmetsp:Transcript_17945/g.71824  ORF Transcript_17945/g.71824 Transcript_17945/m.71824 type:complete len:139 (-) Transcript_17945:3677-4093(-)